MLLPDNTHTDIIMVATGTGVAPFRSFVHRLFAQGASAAAQPFTGLAWLFLGVTDSRSVLYEALWDDLRRNHSEECFRLELALSREQRNESGTLGALRDTRMLIDAFFRWQDVCAGPTAAALC